MIGDERADAQSMDNFEIKILASGSKGNAYIIRDGDHQILIDPGIRFQEMLEKSGFDLDSEFCLISHEHKDHCKAAKHIALMGIPLVMSQGTAENIGLWASTVAVSEVPITSFDGWTILPFSTQHDAIEPLGFLIQTPSEKKILYATDTYYIKYCFQGVSHFLIECNYMKEILDTNDDLHPAHKDRVRRSHFEIENVKEFFRNQNLSKTEAIYLIHLSEDNSDADYFKREIQALTGLPVYLP